MEERKNHIYINPDVAQVRDLHAPVLTSFDISESILELLDRMAINLYNANIHGDSRSEVEIKNYLNPGEFIQVDDKIRIDLKAAREVMAREHGFGDWEEVKYGGRVSLQPGFEMAVDFLIMGNIVELKAILDKYPHLVIQRSAYYHKASLFHYISSNGVEIRRQVVPDNLPEMTRLLLERGADQDARGYFYGTMMNTKSLFQSGTHAREAGVYEEVLQLLK